MTCPNCGLKNPPNATSCACGHDFASVRTDVRSGAAVSGKGRVQRVVMAVLILALLGEGIVALHDRTAARSSLDFLTVGSHQVPLDQESDRVRSEMDGVYRAVKAIQGATEIGIKRAAFAELRTKLATELLLVSDKMRANPGLARSLQPHIDRYRRILALYNVSDKVWGCRIAAEADPSSAKEALIRLDSCIDSANPLALGIREDASPQDIWVLAAKIQEEELLGVRTPDVYDVRAIKPVPSGQAEVRETMNTSIVPKPADEQKKIDAGDVAPNGTSEARIEADIRQVLEVWKKTMLSQDLSGQVACYAPVVEPYFQTPHATLSEVAASKMTVFQSYPNVTKYELSDVSFEHLETDRAVVSFDKEWEALGRGRFAGKERESLDLKPFDGKWRITAERELKVYWVSK